MSAYNGDVKVEIYEIVEQYIGKVGELLADYCLTGEIPCVTLSLGEGK